MDTKNRTQPTNKPLLDKNNKKHFLLSWGVIVLFAALATWLVAGIFAAGPRVTLSSSESSVKKNQSFDVTVGIDAGTTELTIGQVYVTYDPSQVSFVSTDYSSSSFNTASPENDSGSGFVKMSRYQFPPPYPSGDMVVGKIRFTSLVDSGDIVIGVDTSSDNTTFLGSAENGSDVTSGADTLTISAIEDTQSEEPPDDDTSDPVTVSYPLTADKTAVRKGDIIKVSSYVDSGDNGISIAKSYLTFNPNHFEFVSRDYDGSAFTNALPGEEEAGSGFVSVARFAPPPFPTSLSLIGSVSLRAIAEGVTSPIALDTGRSETYDGDTGTQTTNDSATAINISIATTGAFEPPEDEQTDPNTGSGGGGTASGGSSGSGSSNTKKKGTPITVVSPDKTRSGEDVKDTDVFLNGEYVGTSTGSDDPVTIDTNNLDPGAYEITTRSQGVNGGVEESSQTFNLENQPLLVKYRLPFVISTVSILAIIAGFILKSLYFHAVPFYKTLH